MVLPDTEATKLCDPLAKKKICSRSPVPGALQQHLFYGEYSAFKYAPIFESDFIQMTKKGEVLSIHKDITVVTVGVMSTSPSFFLPNVMLLARPINSPRGMVCNCRISTDRCPMELTRLFPLCFVNISIHDVYNRQLRLKLANGRAFYLQLYVHPDCENEVFERWMKLVSLLHNSPEKVYGYEAVTPEIECVLEQTSVETLATELSDWQLEEPAMSPAMREYYEANRASSRKSGKSGSSEKPEDCSTRTRSRSRSQSRKSDAGKVGENVEETEDAPDFSQEQDPWPLFKPPETRKKSRGSIGFNLFKKDKSSEEKSPEEDRVPGPVTTPTEDNEKGLKMEGEEKDDGKKLDEGKGRKKEKSKGKEGKEVKQRDKDREKMEKQMEREQQLKENAEKRQQEKDKKKGREDKGGTDKGSRQQAREERRQAREERQQERKERQKAKEAKQREEEEKKQREREERKQREMEEKKKKSQQKDKKKQAKTKGNEEKDNELIG